MACRDTRLVYIDLDMVMLRENEVGGFESPRLAGPAWYPLCKAALEAVLAAALLLLAGPLILLLAALVRLNSRGPGIYSQVRVGMSLVGPRPERPGFVRQLERAIPDYRVRLGVRPGITGLAQVQLPPDEDLAGVRRKVACDAAYVALMGPWLGARIVLATALKVAGAPFEVTRRLLRLPREISARPARGVPGASGGRAPDADRLSGRAVGAPRAWAPGRDATGALAAATRSSRPHARPITDPGRPRERAGDTARERSPRCASAWSKTALPATSSR
jgi:lipopolysaccharide/colanic/teichoic acid biosynthesis glycosyltransferase